MLSRPFLFLFIFFVFLPFLGPLPSAYGGSHGSNRSCSHPPTPQPQQYQIWASSSTYTTAHSNAKSLAHWARSGIKPATSLFPVGLFLLGHDGNSWVSLNKQYERKGWGHSRSNDSPPQSFSRATSAAYGGSQARGQIGAVATGLHYSHSNAWSEPSLQSTPQLTATLDP